MEEILEIDSMIVGVLLCDVRNARGGRGEIDIPLETIYQKFQNYEVPAPLDFRHNSM